MERSLKKILKILQGKLKMDSSSLANHILIFSSIFHSFPEIFNLAKYFPPNHNNSETWFLRFYLFIGFFLFLWYKYIMNSINNNNNNISPNLIDQIAKNSAHISKKCPPVPQPYLS
jgi:hypothetical protein